MNPPDYFNEDCMKIPKHLAIILDGNRRWARQNGKENVWEGHRAGMDNVENIVEACQELGIEYVSMFAFSTENFKRDPLEVKYLFDIFVDFAINNEKREKLINNGVKIKLLGNINLFPERVINALTDLLKATSGGNKLTLGMCFGYGGREEIVQACKSLLRQGADPNDVTEEEFEKHLYSAGMPDIDLMIRTSGESRISNFLLWKLAYAELIFTPTMWPDFNEAELKKCLEEFGERERRYGK